MTKRSNPKRTGGPRSAEGKVAASGNSLKTGAYSSGVLIPGESVEDYELVVQTLEKDFQVEDSVERMLVRQIANIVWKLQRLERIQSHVERNVITRPISASEFSDVGLTQTPGTQFLLDLASPISDRDMDYFLSKAASASMLDTPKIQIELLTVIKNDRPDLYEIIESFFVGPKNNNGYPHAIKVIYVDGPRSTEEELNELDLDSIKDLYQSLIAIRDGCQLLIDRSSQLAEFASLVRMRRLQILAESSSLTRPQEDLLRSMHKLLAELRKQKDWRKVNRLVDHDRD